MRWFQSLEVLLALVDGKEVAPTSTLGALLGLGLPQLLSEVMESEIRELTESRASHRWGKFVVLGPNGGK